jgi:hypothetical protein
MTLYQAYPIIKHFLGTNAYLPRISVIIAREIAREKYPKAGME